MSVQTISPLKAQERIASGGALQFIDVRTAGEYAKLHATGAKLVPLDGLDVQAVAATRKDPTEPIYVICQSGARATQAVQSFSAAGIPNVFCVEGGTAAWEKAGLSVARGGGGAISLERQVRIGAGTLVFIGVVLGWLVHRDFLLLSGFVGAGLVFAGVTDYCGMGMLLAKMPRNRA